MVFKQRSLNFIWTLVFLLQEIKRLNDVWFNCGSLDMKWSHNKTFSYEIKTRSLTLSWSDLCSMAVVGANNCSLLCCTNKSLDGISAALNCVISHGIPKSRSLKASQGSLASAWPWQGRTGFSFSTFMPDWTWNPRLWVPLRLFTLPPPTTLRYRFWSVL